MDYSKVKASVLKTINKKGISAVIKEANARNIINKKWQRKEIEFR